jgi:hypothetical protein
MATSADVTLTGSCGRDNYGFAVKRETGHVHSSAPEEARTDSDRASAVHRHRVGGIAGILAVLNLTVQKSADPIVPKHALPIAQALLEEAWLAPEPA